MSRLSARAAAIRALFNVETRQAYAGAALDAVLQRHDLDPRDRALATEIVYGTLRRQGTLDWVLAQVSNRPLAKLHPWVRAILRSAVYQILYLDRVPAAAAVHESVELAKQVAPPGSSGFVNGVLRALLRRRPHLTLPEAAPDDPDPAPALAVRYSMPEWVVRDWLTQFGRAEAEALLAAMLAPAPLTVRANRLRCTRPELAAALAAAGLTVAESRWSPYGVTVLGSGPVPPAALLHAEPFRQGWCTVQDESSMLVAPAVAPQPGWTVLDVAAAPGGKATHLAELMDDRGRVVAMDVHPHKLQLIADNARRLGLTAVEPVCADARQMGQLYPAQADAVLCDLPCSGLGTLARRPDLRWRKGQDDITALAALQREILAAAARAVRPGGVLVYSTCTLTQAENAGTVAAFLADHPEFRAADLRPYLPPGLRDEPGAADGHLQLLPHRHGSDGFFIARLVRAGNS